MVAEIGPASVTPFSKGGVLKINLDPGWAGFPQVSESEPSSFAGEALIAALPSKYHEVYLEVAGNLLS